MILTYNNQWLIYDAQVFDNFAEPVRYVYTGPNVSAAPTSGIYDTTINLTHSTPQGYDFVEYSATGANVDGNTYCFPNPWKSYSDVIADLTWTE